MLVVFIVMAYNQPSHIYWVSHEKWLGNCPKGLLKSVRQFWNSFVNFFRAFKNTRVINSHSQLGQSSAGDNLENITQRNYIAEVKLNCKIYTILYSLSRKAWTNKLFHFSGVSRKVFFSKWLRLIYFHNDSYGSVNC